MNTFLAKVSNFFDNAFPTPKYLTLDPVAIDISCDAIYFLKLKKDKIGFIPDKYEKISFTKDVDLCSGQLNEEDRKEIISKLISLRKKYKLKYVFSSLSEKENYNFSIIVPKEGQADIVSFIRYQIDENVPIKADEANFNYFVLEEINQKGDLDVAVTVFPKKNINNYTQIFEQAEIFPVSFFSESRALSFALIKKDDQAAYLLVRFLPNRTTVAILEKGVVQYTVELKINIENILKSFESPDAISLKEELNKILIYWFTSKKDFYQHSKIENVLVAGIHSENISLIEFMERVLKIDVESADVWINCFDSQKHSCPMEKALASEYAVAIGLALKCIKY